VGSWLTERRLAQNASRLKQLRAELAQLNEQVDVFADDAADSELRALMSETPGAAQEANEARKHAGAIERHRQHVREQITELEARQDALLDKLSGAK